MATIANTAPGAIVLVHGGFVEGSGWEDVYRILKKDGYRVSIVQNPTTSLAGPLLRLHESQRTCKSARGLGLSKKVLY